MMTVRIPRLLIVDDEAPVREFLVEALSDLCGELTALGNLREAFRALESTSFDVVLTDICLPGCTGMDLLHLSRQFSWDCAIILMTGHASLDLVASSVRLHAADLLLKPFSVDDVIHSISQAYQKLIVRRQHKNERNRLSSGLRERTEQLQLAHRALRNTYRSSLESMVVTLEAREPETYAHSFRVRAYAMHLAKLMSYSPAMLPRLAYAGLLHDIGKIAVSDAVLLKPGRLTPEEFKALQIHPVVGEKIVQRMGFLQEESKMIRHHHERWDGRGYPDGLTGTQIPFGSRLFAVADTLDAMTSNRCYRSSLTLAEARREISACAGTQFDPEVTVVFETVAPETWSELRQQADNCARSAVIPEFSRDSIPDFAPELVELFPAIAGQ
jgi:putative nucleotidyltransferase with HDIG domain